MKTNRRSFLGGAAAAGGAFFIPASRLYGQELPKRQLRLAVVGSGGIGVMTRKELVKAGATVAALCDVNSAALAKQAAEFPGVPTFTDWRKLFEHAKDFDAVAVCTPDHTHAIIALNAMRLGKHVYVQKPLAHSFEECAMLMKEQDRSGVVAQMGNQHLPHTFKTRAALASGVIGPVKEVWCWTDRPAGWWPQGMTAYPAAQPLPGCYTPETWDLWNGPAPFHAYNGALAPFKWRGWWDYGTGAIGDMAIHNAGPAFLELGWGLPTAARAISDQSATVAFPEKVRIELEFAATAKNAHPVKFVWLNADQRPPVFPGLRPNYDYGGNGLVFIGERGIFTANPLGGLPTLIAYGNHDWNDESKEAARTLQQALKGAPPFNENAHYRQFVEAALASEPAKCLSRMSFAAPFTQSLLIGAIALRWPGRRFAFNASAGRFENAPEADAFLKAPARGAFSMKEFA